MNFRFFNNKIKSWFSLPGALSLILLLPLSMLWLYNIKAFEKNGILEITYYDAKDTSKYAMPFPPRRKFSTIYFTGEKTNDEIKFELVRTQIKNLISSNDTTTGVKLRFSDASRYESFVEALVICQKESAGYLIHNSDMWIFNYYAAPEKFPMGCCVCGTFPYAVPPEPSHSSFASINVIWPSGILYLTLIILFIRRQIKSG